MSGLDLVQSAVSVHFKVFVVHHHIHADYMTNQESQVS